MRLGKVEMIGWVGFLVEYSVDLRILGELFGGGERVVRILHEKWSGMFLVTHLLG